MHALVRPQNLSIPLRPFAQLVRIPRVQQLLSRKGPVLLEDGLGQPGPSEHAAAVGGVQNGSHPPLAHVF